MVALCRVAVGLSHVFLLDEGGVGDVKCGGCVVRPRFWFTARVGHGGPLQTHFALWRRTRESIGLFGGPRGTTFVNDLTPLGASSFIGVVLLGWREVGIDLSTIGFHQCHAHVGPRVGGTLLQGPLIPSTGAFARVEVDHVADGDDGARLHEEVRDGAEKGASRRPAFTHVEGSESFGPTPRLNRRFGWSCRQGQLIQLAQLLELVVGRPPLELNAEAVSVVCSLGPVSG